MIVEDRLNRNKNLFSNTTNGIILSKGDDGIGVEDTRIRPSEELPISAQLIDRNASKYLSGMLCNDRHTSNTHSRKHDTTSKSGRKRSKVIDITNKQNKRKSSTQSISKRYRVISKQNILKRNKKTRQYVAMVSMAKNYT